MIKNVRTVCESNPKYFRICTEIGDFDWTLDKFGWNLSGNVHVSAGMEARTY